MSLLTLVLTLIVIGILLWAINKYVPMDAHVKHILNIVVVIVCALIVLQAFGVIDAIRDVKVPRL